MQQLLNFLKKYSDVDVTFIRDFIKIQEHDKTHEPFKVDLDVMSRWLDARKGKLKETLIKSYKKDIDYMILHPEVKQDRHGGHNKEIILLTEDCFKMMCMRSNTKKADKIRYYYLTLEKLVKIYQDKIIENQKKKIDQLTNNLTKNKFPVKGAIYVIAIDDGYKIGKTKNLNKRYELYKNAHKDNPKIKFVFYTNDINRLEKCIKNILTYEEYRDRKEFYVLEMTDIILAIKDCNNLITHFKCESCKKTNKINDLKKHILTHKNNSDKVKFHAIAKY